MKSLVSALAILAFTAGTAAAGCGYHNDVADKGKDAEKTTASVSEQTPKGTTESGDTGRTGDQLAENPESKGETTK